MSPRIQKYQLTDQAEVAIELFNAESRILLQGHDKLHVSLLLECLTDCLDAASRIVTPITETSSGYEPTALMAGISRRATVNESEYMMYLPPQPPILEHRTLKIVDPLRDEHIWCVIDTACNTTCHGKPWRLNMERKLAQFNLGIFWGSHDERWFEGLGGKKAAKIVGKVDIP